MSQRIIKKNGTISTIPTNTISQYVTNNTESVNNTKSESVVNNTNSQITKSITNNKTRNHNGINSQPMIKRKNEKINENNLAKNPKKSHNIIERETESEKTRSGSRSRNNNSEKSKENNLSSNQINPTFILKNININKLISQYEQGLFQHIRPPLAKLTYKGLNRIFLSRLSSKQMDSHSYKFTNKRGEDIIVHTFGHNALKAYINNNDYVPTEPCYWCMTPLNNPDVNLDQICYLVVDYCYINNQHIFWCTIPFCHISCYYRYLLEELKKGRSSNYTVVHMTLFRTYCDVSYSLDVDNDNNDEIVPADDKEVLINNGGFKNYKDYHPQNYKKINFIRNSEVYKIPCRIEFTEC